MVSIFASELVAAAVSTESKPYFVVVPTVVVPTNPQSPVMVSFSFVLVMPEFV
jgi:hypothetical protein